MCEPQDLTVGFEESKNTSTEEHVCYACETVIALDVKVRACGTCNGTICNVCLYKNPNKGESKDRCAACDTVCNKRSFKIVRQARKLEKQKKTPAPTPTATGAKKKEELMFQRCEKANHFNMEKVFFC